MYLGLFLIRTQISWYFKRITHRIMRFKIAFLLFFAVFLQIGVVFNNIFSAPADFLYQDKNSLISKLLFLIFFQLIAICWVAIQRDALQPRKINAFILTLPINRSIIKISQLFMLILANNVILLFYLLPIFSVEFKANFLLCKICFYLFLSTLVAQLSFLSRNIFSLLLIVFLNFMFLLSVDSAIAFFFICALTILSSYYPVSIGRFKFNVNKLNFSFNKFSKLMPVYTLQLKVVLYKFPIELLLRFILALFFLFIIMVFLLHQSSHGNLTLFQFFYFSTTAFIFSGLFYRIASSREDYRSYFQVLPYPKYFWPVKDLQLITSFYTISALIFIMLNAILFPIMCVPLIIGFLFQLILMPIYYSLHTVFEAKGGLYAFVLYLFLVIVEAKVFG